MTKERSRWGGTGAKCRKRRSPEPGWNTKPSSAKTRHESASRGFPFTSVHQERFQRAGETHHQASPRLGWGHFTRVGNDFPWNQGLQLLELLQERSTQRKMHALSDKKKGWMTQRHLNHVKYLFACLKRTVKEKDYLDFHLPFLQRCTQPAQHFLKPPHTPDENLHFVRTFTVCFLDLRRWACVGKTWTARIIWRTGLWWYETTRAVTAQSGHSGETESRFQPVRRLADQRQAEQGHAKAAWTSPSEHPRVLPFTPLSIILHPGPQRENLKR